MEPPYFSPDQSCGEGGMGADDTKEEEDIAVRLIRVYSNPVEDGAPRRVALLRGGTEVDFFVTADRRKYFFGCAGGVLGVFYLVGNKGL